MLPIDAGRLRFDFQHRAMQAQIVTLVRSNHELIASQAHWVAVGLFSGVYDIDPSHICLIRVALLHLDPGSGRRRQCRWRISSGTGFAPSQLRFIAAAGQSPTGTGCRGMS
jgi:hypothetical protein